MQSEDEGDGRKKTTTTTKQVLCFRGENINGIAPTEASRTCDPERLLRGYYHSLAARWFAVAATPLLHATRASLPDLARLVGRRWGRSETGAPNGSGNGDGRDGRDRDTDGTEEVLTGAPLLQPHHPQQPQHSQTAVRSGSGSNGLSNGLSNGNGRHSDKAVLATEAGGEGGGGEEEEDDSVAAVFTAHEALELPLEEAFTRPSGGGGVGGGGAAVVSSSHSDDDDNSDRQQQLHQQQQQFFNLSAHFVWVGDRSRQVDGAHVECVACLVRCHTARVNKQANTTRHNASAAVSRDTHYIPLPHRKTPTSMHSPLCALLLPRPRSPPPPPAHHQHCNHNRP